MKRIFVFDVESTSLFGTGFAVGAVVLEPITEVWKRKTGLEESDVFVRVNDGSPINPVSKCGGYLGCITTTQYIKPTGKYKQIDSFELLSLAGLKKACDWVKDNVIPSLHYMKKCNTDKELREQFYSFYMKHKDNCDIYSDVNFPVETNFLTDIVRDDVATREFTMPYPLLDIANQISVDIDRVEKYEKDTGLKLRKHNPLDDSIASAHCLFC